MFPILIVSSASEYVFCMLRSNFPVIPILCSIVHSFFLLTRLYALFMSILALKIGLFCVVLLSRSIIVLSIASVEELPFWEPICSV